MCTIESMTRWETQSSVKTRQPPSTWRQYACAVAERGSKLCDEWLTPTWFSLTATHTHTHTLTHYCRFFSAAKAWEQMRHERTNAEHVRDLNAPLTFHVLSKCSVCERICQVLLCQCKVLPKIWRFSRSGSLSLNFFSDLWSQFWHNFWFNNFWAHFKKQDYISSTHFVFPRLKIAS
jgi:hypothetical protein